jgi:hypothetical protein
MVASNGPTGTSEENAVLHPTHTSGGDGGNVTASAAASGGGGGGGGGSGGGAGGTGVVVGSAASKRALLFGPDAILDSTFAAKRLTALREVVLKLQWPTEKVPSQANDGAKHPDQTVNSAVPVVSYTKKNRQASVRGGCNEANENGGSVVDGFFAMGSWGKNTKCR